jgi:hypothetical protein
LNKIFGISFLLITSFNIAFSQSIIKEGKGIDSLTLGIKESKVIAILGNNFNRKSTADNEYILEYSEKLLSFVFDNDSIVYEIIIEPNLNLKTSKGLEIKQGLTITDIENIYGDDWWATKENGEVGFDIGIRFDIKNDKVYQIVLEESDLEEGNDYSFYEYLEGKYIPKNLNECYNELNSTLDKKLIEEIKNKTEAEFTTNSHFGMGLWIRNNWGLWKGSRLYHFFKTKRISHPDDMSGIILTSYHRKLNGIDTQLEKQIKYYQEYWEKQKKE